MEMDNVTLATLLSKILMYTSQTYAFDLGNQGPSAPSHTFETAIPGSWPNPFNFASWKSCKAVPVK